MHTVWRVVGGGSLQYAHSRRPGCAIDAGWRWQLLRPDTEELRPICVEVDEGCLAADGLPSDALEAIESHGLSAISAIVSHEEPPATIVVSRGGIELLF